MGNRRVVERWVEALETDDLAAQRELLHPEFIGRYPQSNEIIRGPDNRIAISENYPDRDRVKQPVRFQTISGSDDAFVTAPAAFAWSVVHLSGSDDEFTVTGTVLYPDGVNWHQVALVVVRDGRIWRETSYYAEPFEAPSWRAQWAETDSPDGSR